MTKEFEDAVKEFKAALIDTKFYRFLLKCIEFLDKQLNKIYGKGSK